MRGVGVGKRRDTSSGIFRGLDLVKLVVPRMRVYTLPLLITFFLSRLSLLTIIYQNLEFTPLVEDSLGISTKIN